MDSDVPLTLENLKMSSTLGDLVIPLTLVAPTLPSTLVDSTLFSTLVDPTLVRSIRRVTFCLPPPLEDECWEVGIVEESLNWDLSKKGKRYYSSMVEG